VHHCADRAAHPCCWGTASRILTDVSLAEQVLGELIDQEGIIVYQGARYKPLPAIAQVMLGK
jgi:hypothetical protein